MSVRPPSPTRFIASKSAVMPSRVRFPFSQNPYAHGLAESGGVIKLFFKSSAAKLLPVASNANRLAIIIRLNMDFSILYSVLSV
jgi:hypothetical protein